MIGDDDLIQTIARIVRILELLNIPYHLTGGVSVSLYGEPRSTQDVDVVISPELLRRHLQEFITESKSGFDLNEQQIDDALNRLGMFQLLDQRNYFKVDCFVREAIPGELSRSEKLEITPELVALVVSRADAILSKLVWISKGSHRSRRDVQWMYHAMTREQQDALQLRAKELNLFPLLEVVLTDREPIE